MFTAIAGAKIENARISLGNGAQITNMIGLPFRDPQPIKVWFQVPVGIQSFCGRAEFLNDLHKILQQCRFKDDVIVFSRLKVLSGLGGIGKTQTALKYIQQFRHSYRNVIWMQAESKNTMKNAFFQLAKELKIPTQISEGKEETLNNVVKMVFKRICDSRRSTLFVFDNADDFESGIEQFLPLTVDPGLTNLVILVTSRNQEWELRNEKFQVLRLDVFSYEESLKLVLTQLEISDGPEIRQETREFIELMGGLPLALQQSVSYIKEKRKQTGQRYKFSDYIDEFKSAMDKILDCNKIPGSPSTIFVTWNVTFEKIKTQENGKSSIEILETLSFLYADKIPVALIQSLFPKLGKTKIWSCLTLLEKYSLIKCESVVNDEGHVSIHRQLQFVIMKNLKDLTSNKSVFDNFRERFWGIFKTVDSDKSLESVIDKIFEGCRAIFKTINLAKSADIFINIHQLVSNPFNFIPMTDNFLDFMREFSIVLRDAGRYSESLTYLEKIHIIHRESLGENHEKTLNTQRMLVECTSRLGKYDEALALCVDVLERMKTHLGPDHPSTLGSMHEMGRVLFHQEKYPESSSLLKQVLEHMQKVLGESHQSTLNAQELLALVYSQLGEFDGALKFLGDVEKKRVEILGADHPETLIAMHNRATTLFKMERFEEASNLLRQLLAKEQTILGDSHPNTITTLRLIAEIVEKEGKLDEALELRRQVLQGRKSVLGDDHPDTKRVEQSILKLVLKMASHRKQ